MTANVETLAYVAERGTPWHGVGNPVHGLMTSVEALEASGLDWEVTKEPITVASSGILIPDRYATVRSSDQKPLGIVGSRYQVLQNKAAFDWADSLVDSGDAKYETAGALKGGTRVFLSMELDHLEINVPGDPSAMKTYLLVATSHDGSMPTGAWVNHVRVVCTNTMAAAVGSAVSSFTVRHTGTIEGKLAAARAALGISFRNTEAIKVLTSALAKTKMRDKAVDEAYRMIWPAPTKGEVSRNAEKAFENYLTSDTLVDIRGNAWGAFNGITEFLDHLVEYKAVTWEKESARADALLFGSASDAKAKALSVLAAVGRN